MPRNPCFDHGCSRCCHDTEMPLTEEDARRLEGRGHDRAAFSSVDAGGVLRLRTRDETTPQGRPCHFLAAGACSVYADRPAGCRVYPFVLDEGDRVARDEDCPHSDEFEATPAVRRSLLRIVAVVDREAAVRSPRPPGGP